MKAIYLFRGLWRRNKKKKRTHNYFLFVWHYKDLVYELLTGIIFRQWVL